MGRYFTSGLLAGLTGAVVWTSIGLWAGMNTRTIGLWALIFMVVGTIGTMIIASVIGGQKATTRT